MNSAKTADLMTHIVS